MKNIVETQRDDVTCIESVIHKQNAQTLVQVEMPAYRGQKSFTQGEERNSNQKNDPPRSYDHFFLRQLLYGHTACLLFPFPSYRIVASDC